MTRFLLTAMMISSFVISARAEEKAPAVPGAMPGAMIDQMMNQEALADAASAIITAESALPKKNDDTPNKDEMDSAVKLALAKIPEAKQEIPLETAVKNQVAATTTAYNEAQQPVFNNDAPAPAAVKTKSASSSSQMWWRMISSLAIVLVVFGGGVYGLRKWPGAKKLTARGKMIEVLSQHHLGPKRSLAVVRVAGEACLIGITDQNITILKTLSLLDDDVPVQTKENEGSVKLSSKFQKTLAATFTKSQDRSAAPSSEKAEAASYTRAAKVTTHSSQASQATPAAHAVPEDEFTMQGLREIVGEKLKSMREI